VKVNSLGLTVVVLRALCSTAFAQTVITTSTIDGGGLHATSANYAMDGSLGGIGGVSSASADTVKDGYIGQLTEVVSIVVTAQPNSVGIGSTALLSGTATLDDSTVASLSGSDLAWSSPNEPYPVAAISQSGVLTPVTGNLWVPTPAVVSGYYLGVTSNATLVVFAPDGNNDGIADWWRLAYFGTTSSNSPYCATCDADGTGQDNLFKYVAGLNPTNPASIFVLKITPVAGQPTQKMLTYDPILVGSGQVYMVQFTTNLVGASYAALATMSGPTTNGAQANVIDTQATQTLKFYRVNISLP